MAIDEWLLDQAVSRPATAGAMLRFYRWRRPSLSIGFHQRRLPDHWQPVLRARGVDLVRRPSGGRAVLHAGDLTYALVWPQAPQRRTEAYQQACGWLRAAFAALDQPLCFGRQAASGERSSCFASSTAADLVHANGAKRIGSAQLWRGGCLLQHGSILLEPPRQLWQELFHHPPPVLPALPLEGEALVGHLRRSAERHWPHLALAGLTDHPLQARERAAIAPRLARYRPTPEAGEGRGDTSPAATMPRAT
jgi:lipoate-protein ligase A